MFEKRLFDLIDTSVDIVLNLIQKEEKIAETLAKVMQEERLQNLIEEDNKELEIDRRSKLIDLFH